MAYTAPTITASGGTFAQLQTYGLIGQIEALITANTGAGCSLTQGQINGIRRVMSPLMVSEGEKAGEHVNDWLRGDPITAADFQQLVLDKATVFAVIATALNEIGTLQAANAGTLGVSTSISGLQTPVRTWP